MTSLHPDLSSPYKLKCAVWAQWNEIFPSFLSFLFQRPQVPKTNKRQKKIRCIVLSSTILTCLVIVILYHLPLIFVIVTQNTIFFFKLPNSSQPFIWFTMKTVLFMLAFFYSSSMYFKVFLQHDWTSCSFIFPHDLPFRSETLPIRGTKFQSTPFPVSDFLCVPAAFRHGSPLEILILLLKKKKNTVIFFLVQF